MLWPYVSLEPPSVSASSPVPPSFTKEMGSLLRQAWCYFFYIKNKTKQMVIKNNKNTCLPYFSFELSSYSLLPFPAKLLDRVVCMQSLIFLLPLLSSLQADFNTSVPSPLPLWPPRFLSVPQPHLDSLFLEHSAHVLPQVIHTGCSLHLQTFPHYSHFF